MFSSCLRVFVAASGCTDPAWMVYSEARTVGGIHGRVRQRQSRCYREETNQLEGLGVRSKGARLVRRGAHVMIDRRSTSFPPSGSRAATKSTTTQAGTKPALHRAWTPATAPPSGSTVVQPRRPIGMRAPREGLAPVPVPAVYRPQSNTLPTPPPGASPAVKARTGDAGPSLAAVSPTTPPVYRPALTVVSSLQRQALRVPLLAPSRPPCTGCGVPVTKTPIAGARSGISRARMTASNATIH